MVVHLPSSDGCWWELPQRRVPTYINNTVRFCIEGRVSKVSSDPTYSPPGVGPLGGKEKLPRHSSVSWVSSMSPAPHPAFIEKAILLNTCTLK